MGEESRKRGEEKWSEWIEVAVVSGCMEVDLEIDGCRLGGGHWWGRVVAEWKEGKGKVDGRGMEVT